MPQSGSADLWPACFVYWKGFSVLSKSRSWELGGMGGAIPNRIPYTEMCVYFRDHFPWEVAELDLFVYLVQSLDEVYCSHQVKLVNSKRPKSPPRS